MLQCNVYLRNSFDQARLIRHNRILASNGIDPSGEDSRLNLNDSMLICVSGMPLDSKAVTHL